MLTICSERIPGASPHGSPAQTKEDPATNRERGPFIITKHRCDAENKVDLSGLANMSLSGRSQSSQLTCPFDAGDKVTIGVWNAQTGSGTAHYEMTVDTASQHRMPPASPQ